MVPGEEDLVDSWIFKQIVFQNKRGMMPTPCKQYSCLIDQHPDILNQAVKYLHSWGEDFTQLKIAWFNTILLLQKLEDSKIIKAYNVCGL